MPLFVTTGQPSFSSLELLVHLIIEFCPANNFDLVQDSSSDDQPSTSSVDVSSTPSSIERVEDPDTIEDRRHQSSPVSVLEPFFIDNICPESTLCNSGRLSLQGITKSFYFSSSLKCATELVQIHFCS